MITSFGQLARFALGPRMFQRVARVYRSFFVDVGLVAEMFPPLRPDSVLLDVGGGDGQILDSYLTRFPTNRATMIDLAPEIGQGLGDAARDRVELLPGMSVRDFATQVERKERDAPSVVIISDVLHHVPTSERQIFLDDLALLRVGQEVTFVFKEIQPGSLKSWLAYLADRYITGDRFVAFISKSELEMRVGKSFGGAEAVDSDLLRNNPPNYCVRFSFPHTPRRAVWVR